MEAISARSVVILMHSQTLHSPTGMESGHFISGIRDIYMYGMESGHLRGGCWPLLLCGLVCVLLVWVSCLSPACFWSRQTPSLSVRTGCVWEPGAACKELLVCIRTTILSCGHCEKSLYLLAAAPCKVLPSLAYLAVSDQTKTWSTITSHLPSHTIIIIILRNDESREVISDNRWLVGHTLGVLPTDVCWCACREP